MQIIKNYWSDKQEQIVSETQFLSHIENYQIKKVYIGFKQIKNFKFDIENNRMILRYSLSKSAKLKYYANLLNHSICVNENTAIFLQDANWLDYNVQTLNEQTLKLLK